MDIDKIAVGPNPPHEINVIVEVPLRSDPIKYEFDKAAGADRGRPFPVHGHVLPL
jgi:inorganic pyrophosphatase